MRRINLPGITVHKLDIGCGKKELWCPDALGVDIEDFGQEIVWDLRQGIPLPDNCVEAFHSSHSLEHFTDEEGGELFKEIYRVAKDGAVLEAIMPYAGIPEAYCVGHKSQWHETRLKGIVDGFNEIHLDHPKERFVIEKVEKLDNRVGYPELHFILRIKK